MKKIYLLWIKEIFDIISKFKTQEFTIEDKNNYYPISLYCQCCGKDSTTIINYNKKTHEVEYKCVCGDQRIQRIEKSGNIKLQWKIDWPMRWQEEGVIFEPGGRDHSAENGSYAVSKVIAKQIFDYDAPSYIAYDFIGIKGANGKMASSAGNVLTLTDLLRVYDKNIILWFYAKNKPNHQFNIALDEDVLRYYAEFDSVNEEENQWLKDTLVVLQQRYNTTQELQNNLYSVVKNGEEDSKTVKNKQKRYFQIIYNLILGKDSGPKKGLLLSAMNYDVIKSKLQKSDELVRQRLNSKND